MSALKPAKLQKLTVDRLRKSVDYRMLFEVFCADKLDAVAFQI